MATPRRSRTGIVIGLVVALVVGVLLVLTTVQRRLIYFPDPTPVPPVAEILGGARDVSLQTSDGLELGAWFVPADPAADLGMAVLLAPGNGGNRAGRAGLARELSRRGLAVLLLDYRGYGGNPGSPSEDGLARDAFAASEALEALGFPPDRTIYLGESLGTGVVTRLQLRRPAAGLVLRSPFTELADVAAHHYPWLPARILLRDRFEVTAALARIDAPVTVVYGDRDSVVPSELSARVAEEARNLHERLVLSGADHNDEVMFGPQVADAVSRLAAAIT
jgi:pimeloyl-ACP methyl ester carboxylesterase